MKCQMAVMRLSDVADLNPLGVELAARPHAADDVLVVLNGIVEEKNFRRKGVYGIHDIVEGLVHQVDDGLVPQEIVSDMQADVRVDVADALCHYFCFRASLGAVQGNQLSVHITWRNRVAVHDGEFAYAGTYQLLGNVSADSAQSHDEDMAIGQLKESFFAKEQTCSFLPIGIHEVQSVLECETTVEVSVDLFLKNGERDLSPQGNATVDFLDGNIGGVGFQEEEFQGDVG